MKKNYTSEAFPFFFLSSFLGAPFAPFFLASSAALACSASYSGSIATCV